MEDLGCYGDDVCFGDVDFRLAMKDPNRRKVAVKQRYKLDSRGRVIYVGSRAEWWAKNGMSVFAVGAMAMVFVIAAIGAAIR